jgi:outer membrane protein TolC
MKSVKLTAGRIGLLLILGLLLCGPLAAQASPQARDGAVKISPDEAVERAIKNNLGLESERTAIATKKRASDLSWNQFIPSVTVNGALSINNSREKTTVSGLAPVPWDDRFSALGLTESDFERTIPGFDGTMYNYVMPFSIEGLGPRWNLAIPIQTSLTLSMAMLENMNRLRLDYEGGLIAYDKAKLQLERDVRKAYNNMLLLQENISLLRESFEAAGRRVQMAQANYNAGLAPELTLLQTQVAVENMKPVIDQAENGLRISMASFAMFLGLPYDTPFELEALNEGAHPNGNAADFIPFDVKDLISKAAAGRPDVKELRHTILMLQSARKAQYYALFPFLNLSWGITPLYIPDPLKVWRRSGALTFTVGMRLHSLLPFSQENQAVLNMDSQIASANIGLARMIQGTEIEIYNTVLALERTRITAEAQAQTINLAERSRQLTEQAYLAGFQDLLQLQNAELELRQARVQMLEQQFVYLNGLLDLEYSIGVPFGTLSNGAR